MSYSVGDFGKLHPTPIYGWNVGMLDFIPAAVDANGQLVTSSGGVVSTVDQGAAGVARWLVDGSGVTQPVSSATLATSAKQDTEIASLASIDGKTPALGQQLAAASSPVVLTAAQIATLTPPAAITGFLTEADFDTKAGSLTETAPATDTASSGLNGRLQRIAQRITSLIAALGSPFQAGGSIGNTTFAATQATAGNLNATVVGTGTFAAQVTGSVTANAGTNLNTSALALDASISTLNTSVNTLLKPASTLAAVTAITNPVTVNVGLTDAQLRATPVPVSGTVTASGPLTDAQLRAAAVPVSGTLTDGGAGKTLKSQRFSLSATGTVITAVPTKRLKVYGVKLIASAPISVNFRDGGSTLLEDPQPLAANGGFVEGMNPPGFFFATSAGNSLDLVISGSGTASGRVSYWDDDAA